MTTGPSALTPYDEYPVHQAPYPFSYVPSTDYNWDDGYWFGVFNPDEKVFLGTYMRINPNSDMIGGCAFVNVAGVQTTLRFSRCWRRSFELEVGPYHMRVEVPLKKIRLVLDKNDSGLSFDVLWEGTSPAFLEDHHVAVNRGRRGDVFVARLQGKRHGAASALGLVRVGLLRHLGLVEPAAAAIP